MTTDGTGGWRRLRNVMVGRARNLSDASLFHKVSLIALFAWVGLGADGLSSSCYGPEESFRALGVHTALAPLLGLASMVTIAVICASYAQIIAAFPGGGGGYLVASKLLSPAVGVVSGCALLVDYVLTIAISVASGADALFSLLPPDWAAGKLLFAAAGIVALTVLNMRGVRESVLLWVPIFFVFLGTHGFAILYALFHHVGDLPAIASQSVADMGAAHRELGWFGLFLLLVRSYSVGAGTYTGIEAVSNGLPILREPRVATGRRTMLYMGISLGFMVGGLLLCYLLYDVQPQHGQTLNATLLASLTTGWPGATGHLFVTLALGSATVLLIIAAQAGFLDGPRVLANLALDRWAPARFATFSDRLVTENGILLMGASALAVLLATRGAVALLVVLYSINVFITFTLSQAGMVRHWLQQRGQDPRWRQKLAVNGVGVGLTSFILVSLCITKFWKGGWITLLVTALLVAIAFRIRRHYRQTRRQLERLDSLVEAVELERAAASTPRPPAGGGEPSGRAGGTAVLFVNGYNGLGLHTLMALLRMFPGVFRKFVFIQIGIVDAGNFKGAGEIDNLRRHVESEVERYAAYLRGRGFEVETLTAIDTDVVERSAALAAEVIRRHPQAVFFGGQLVFAAETRLTRLLHNHVVFALQRKLFRGGMPFLILPIRV